MSRVNGSPSPPHFSTVSGRPLHPPDRFEATREKSPNRVEGGKKAAASRGLEIHDSEDQQPKVESSEIPTTDRYGGDLLGPDFHPGKNPTRQEVSRRVARERGHEAFVEMGRKGGATQGGIHAGQINKLDADDYRTYLEHPEVGVPEKNPNRVVGGKKAAATRGNEVHGDPNVGPNAGGNTTGNTREQDQKDPVRVEAGKKAARSRGFHVRDDDEQENQNQSENEEMGDDGEDEQNQGENQTTGIQKTGKNPNRVRGGKQAARTKGQHVHDDDEVDASDLSETGKNPNPHRVEGGKKAASHFSHEHFVELGRKGAAARIEKYHQHRRNHPQTADDEGESENELMEGEGQRRGGGGEGRGEHHKNPHRVEGGKKAASHFPHEHFVELGKKGSSARIEKYHQNRHPHPQAGGSEESESESEGGESHRHRDSHVKNPHRVEAGKRTASRFSPEHYSELGKKGAEARIEKYHLHRHPHTSTGAEEENESENEGESHPDVESHGKNPRRVEAGRKGAAAVIEKYHFQRHAPSTRGGGGGGGSIQRSSSSSPTYRGRVRSLRSRSDEYDNDSGSFEDQNERPPQNRRSFSGSSSSSRGARGRRGMNRPDDEDVSDEEYDDSRASRESIYTHAGFPLSVSATRDDGRSGARVRGGQMAALKRGLSVERGEEEMASKNPKRMRGAAIAASRRSHQDFVEMGRKGGRARGSSQREDGDEMMEGGGEGEQHKNPHRVEGGKKAASHFPHEHFVELGKKGSAARIEKYHLHRLSHPSSGVEQSNESENESENEGEIHGDVDSHGKNPRRVEAGRKGAAARWGKDSIYDQEDDKDRSDYGEQSSKQTGRYRSKREADTDIQSPSRRTRHLVY